MAGQFADSGSRNHAGQQGPVPIFGGKPEPNPQMWAKLHREHLALRKERLKKEEASLRHLAEGREVSGDTSRKDAAFRWHFRRKVALDAGGYSLSYDQEQSVQEALAGLDFCLASRSGQ